MSVKAMGWAYDQHGLKPVTKAVLVALGNISDEEGYCWPSMSRIAAMVEISTRSAQRHVRMLEEQGYLAVERERVRESGARTSNAYRLPMAARQLPLVLHRENSDTPYDKLSPAPDKGDRGPVTQPCQGGGDTGVTPYELPLEHPLEQPKGATAPVLSDYEKKSGITLERFFEVCKAKGEDPIPENDSIFTYATKAKIPFDFVHLAWKVFRGRHRTSGKRYRDWRQAFHRYIEATGYGLWALDSQSGYVLTAKGKQAQLAHAK